MDLRGIANGISNTVNANRPLSVYVSDGFLIGNGQKQVAKYLPAVAGFGQVQALDSVDLKQLDGMNIQGTIRAIYLYGNIAGVIKPNSRGGDIIKFTDGDTKNWLVVKVLEHWPNWVKCAIVQQDDSCTPLTSQ